MKQRFTLLAAVAMLFCGLSLFAQDRAISGKVIADDGSVLPGVSVTVRGTTRGATTDADGNYKISVPEGSKLRFSFIGFSNQEVTVGSQNIIDIKMIPDVSQLQEVVVTALGISRDKKALNYSVQEIKGDKITAARDANVANALAGKIAGVQVLGQSAAKFGTPNIRIRGVNSLTGGNPLYVVDGTPTDINQVNMDDVESLSVF